MIPWLPVAGVALLAVLAVWADGIFSDLRQWRAKRRLQRDCGEPQERRNGLSEYEYKTLADYNGEWGRGITHSPSWRAEMARLQARWNAGERERMIREGWTELPGGGWIKSPG